MGSHFKIDFETGRTEGKQDCKRNRIPQRTIERDLGQLKEKGAIVYKGSPKTGGYFLNVSEEQ